MSEESRGRNYFIALGSDEEKVRGEVMETVKWVVVRKFSIFLSLSLALSSLRFRIDCCDDVQHV